MLVGLGTEDEDHAVRPVAEVDDRAVAVVHLLHHADEVALRQPRQQPEVICEGQPHRRGHADLSTGRRPPGSELVSGCAGGGALAALALVHRGHPTDRDLATLLTKTSGTPAGSASARPTGRGRPGGRGRCAR